jgi:hypothetical protein
VGHRLEDVSRQSVPKFVRGIDGFVFVESVDCSVEYQGGGGRGGIWLRSRIQN